MDASACDVRYQNKLLASQSPAHAHEVYLLEWRAIDADYEDKVEPWRQHFLASNPGVPLPDFLTPGFQSFAARQLPAVAPKPKKSGLRGLPGVGGGIVGLVVIGGCMSMVSTSRPSTEYKTVVSAMTDEEKFIKIVRQETSLPLVSDAALISLAKSACTTLTNGGTSTEVLIAVLENIPSDDQDDVIRTVGIGIAGFCPDQSSKVRG
ncbi:DUF732 domain-containing protein [Arthrobacter sp. GMC3]|uniref:DUF732 domain-containing protein n=1 Tax=Arthrobacter sp. GMC3 TaxID=2058894 RepID=UPI000CE52D66|nr:DUF732 domain-containing protein [Arthrobacter sp. GMC3]